MAHCILLRVGEFGEGLPAGFMQEQRVVTETTGAVFGSEDPAFAAIFHRSEQLAAMDQCQRTHEASGALGDWSGVEFREQFAAVVGVGRLLAGEARGAHSGRAVERVDHQSRVVGEHRQIGVLREGASLDLGIRRESGTILVGNQLEAEINERRIKRPNTTVACLRIANFVHDFNLFDV